MQPAADDARRALGPDHVHRLERIIQTQSLLVQAELDLDRFMQLVVDKVRELTGAAGAVVELVEGHDIVYRSASGHVARHVGLRLAFEESLSGRCMRSATALRCDDSETDERVDRAACRRVGARSMICAPLFDGDNAIGVLKAMSTEPGAFDDDDLRSLGLMAGAFAAALGRQMAFDARAHAESRLRASEERMRAMLEHAHDAVVSMDDAGRVSQWNRAAERLFGWAPIEAMGQPLAELVVPPGLRDEFDRLVAGFSACESLEHVHQRVGVPAVDRAGRELAIEMSLTATRLDGRWELTAFGHDVSERKQLELRLREMALCDGLTGLANRRAFMEALEKAVSRARRLGHSMALLFMDLDRFKQINDHFGHHVGDLALRAFAHRLERCVRKGDTVARLGGDEFTVLAEGIESAEQAEAMAHKIVEALAAPLDIHGVRLRTSIGISLYREPADASQFLRQADRAMYLAKHHGAGRNGVATYVSVEALLE